MVYTHKIFTLLFTTSYLLYIHAGFFQKWISNACKNKLCSFEEVKITLLVEIYPKWNILMVYIAKFWVIFQEYKKNSNDILPLVTTINKAKTTTTHLVVPNILKITQFLFILMLILIFANYNNHERKIKNLRSWESLFSRKKTVCNIYALLFWNEIKTRLKFCWEYEEESAASKTLLCWALCGRRRAFFS